jgi:hypothetical protein
MDVNTLIKVVSYAVTAITAIIPFCIGIVKAIKARKKATTEAEKEAAKSDLKENMEKLVAEAESAYSKVDAALKSSGSTAGVAKKDSVLTKLMAVALQKGYNFDSEYWSESIDNFVALTKQVNTTITTIKEASQE